MKITEEQLRKIHKIYVDYDGDVFGAMRAAIESIPEPIPRLRPISEMPDEMPEGAVRLTGGVVDNYIAMSSIRCSLDTIFLDVLPPLKPEPPKLTIQDELVTALEGLVNHGHSDDCNYLNFANAQCNCGVSEAEALIAKAKGGQP